MKRFDNATYLSCIFKFISSVRLSIGHFTYLKIRHIFKSCNIYLKPKTFS